MNLEQVPTSYVSLESLANFLRRNFPRISTSWNVEHHTEGRHAFAFENGTYDANNFTMNTGTWTVTKPDVITYRYARVGRNLLHINFSFQFTTISAAAGNELRFRIPGGFIATDEGFTGNVFISGSDNGPTVGFCVARAGAFNNMIAIFKPDVTAWAASADNTGVRGAILIGIED